MDPNTTYWRVSVAEPTEDNEQAFIDHMNGRNDLYVLYPDHCSEAGTPYIVLPWPTPAVLDTDAIARIETAMNADPLVAEYSEDRAGFIAETAEECEQARAEGLEAAWCGQNETMYHVPVVDPNWRALELWTTTGNGDADGPVRANSSLAAWRALDEFRESEGVSGWWFANPDESEGGHDLASAGPAHASDIDWAGFDEAKPTD